jgi:hypothetical protein
VATGGRLSARQSGVCGPLTFRHSPAKKGIGAGRRADGSHIQHGSYLVCWRAARRCLRRAAAGPPWVAGRAVLPSNRAGLLRCQLPPLLVPGASSVEVLLLRCSECETLLLHAVGAVRWQRHATVPRRCRQRHPPLPQRRRQRWSPSGPPAASGSSTLCQECKRSRGLLQGRCMLLCCTRSRRRGVWGEWGRLLMPL